jgi:hypothetical protein
MDDIPSKALLHSRIAEAAIYLTEVMVSVDSSIGGALVVVSGRLAWQLYRKLTRCPSCCAQ